MMRIDVNSNPKDFLAQNGEFLYRAEAEHNLILSLAEMAAKKNDKSIQFYTLSNDDGFVMAAVQQDGRNLVVSRAAQDGVEFLAENLAGKKLSFPGVVGPADVAAAFSNTWASATGQRFAEYMDQIIYSLKKVSPPADVEGVFRLAEPKDKKMIGEWTYAFTTDAHLPKSEQITPDQGQKHAEERIAAGRIGVWCVDGKPVAQASAGGTEKAARISLVYTPPEHRGKGYASAVVSALSQKMLDEGKKMCCLYADARNPVSNSIYRKIGYEFVGRSSLYVVDRAAKD